MNVNKNYQNIADSYLFSTIAKKVSEFAQKNPDKKIIKLGIGDVTLPLCKVVVNALKRASEEMGVKETFHGYGPEQGYDFLKSKIQSYYRSNHVALDNDEIFISDGAKSDLGNILDLFDVNNTVLVPDPVYPVYVDTNTMAGRKIVYIDANAENNFLPLPDESIKADIIYICSPNNPTGAVYPAEILGEIAKLAISNNFLILADEMYSKLVYEGDFVSMASLPNMKEHVIIVNGFSKTYAMTGWRLGYLLADSRIVTNIMKVHQYSSTCSPTFIQKGMVAAIKKNETEADVQNMIKQFKLRRNVLINELNNIEKIKFVEPKGAFYALIDVSATGLNGEEFAARLLKDEHVAVVPVVSMGKDKVYDDYIRISFAASEDNIRNGIRAIGRLADSIK